MSVATGPDAAGEARQEILRAISPASLPDPELHRRIVGWMQAAAPNTVRAIRSDLRIVEAYQRIRNCPTLPLTPHALYLLVDEQSRAGKRKASLNRLIASLVRLHALAGFPNCVDDNVRWKLKELARIDKRTVKQAFGLRLKGDTLDVVADVPKPLSVMRLLDSIPDDPRGLRDCALISMAYDAGLRRSELVRIQVEHIERLTNGDASLFIPRSKTDQAGDGARAWLSARSIKHVDAWLGRAAIEAGYVFRSLSYRVASTGHLADGAVSKILQQRVAHLLEQLKNDGELSDDELAKAAVRVSSHSLRVGCDQDLFAAGVDIGAIMQGLRWSSPKQPLAYARHLAPATSKLAATMRLAT
ncbi:tyrosine-type recombinase/integrase [Glacieibacterium frigidum]|nr:tyrosine-type recombinase/integrase [Glacieibacterium frigidum]